MRGPRVSPARPLDAMPEEHASSHEHVFHSENRRGALGARWAAGITVLMMIAEIAAGWAYGSMALTADGWHMSTHAFALGITALAYSMSRRLAGDRRFSLGAWKIEVLGGFASAIVLGVVALSMAGASMVRLFRPETIRFDHALVVAVIGLGVNVLCAWLLSDSHDHGHGHDHPHDHDHDHERRRVEDAADGREHAAHDLNLRAAYLHVVADALTSVLAIVALLCGKYFAWIWLDAVMGIVGAVIILTWSYALVRATARVLLDREMDDPVAREIREVVESGGDSRLVDLHLTRVSRGGFAAALTVATTSSRTAADFRRDLAVHEELVHLTIEVAVSAKLP